MDPGSGMSTSRIRTSAYLASVIQMKTGMLLRRSRSVGNLMPALVVRKRAQGKTERQRSMVEASKAGLDVAKALAIGELGKAHGQKLVPGREASRPTPVRILPDALLEFLVRRVLDQLCEHGSSLVHAPAYGGEERTGSVPRGPETRRSNRSRLWRLLNDYEPRASKIRRSR